MFATAILAILVLFLGIPAVLTIINIINLFLKDGIMRKFTVTATAVIGTLYTFLLYLSLNFKPWYEVIYINPATDEVRWHEPISSENSVFIVVFSLLASCAIVYLNYRGNASPPLALALSVAFIYSGIAISSLIIVQLSEHISSDPFPYFFLALYPFNYIIISIRLLVKTVLNAASAPPPRGRVNSFLYKFTSKSLSLPIVGIVILIPVTAIFTAIFTLFGQAPDAAIKAFTETADWKLSTRIPPPSVYEDGHYLCTAAARGHKKLVKPLRYGVRHGHTVICNRQLLVANAFEELIAERTPRFHRLVRHVYDKYGFPTAKLIKSSVAADITYILMLPLYAIFTLTLYLFDKCPENRIARQYTGMN